VQAEATSKDATEASNTGSRSASAAALKSRQHANSPEGDVDGAASRQFLDVAHFYLFSRLAVSLRPVEPPRFVRLTHGTPRRMHAQPTQACARKYTWATTRAWPTSLFDSTHKHLHEKKRTKSAQTCQYQRCDQPCLKQTDAHIHRHEFMSLCMYGCTNMHTKICLYKCDCIRYPCVCVWIFVYMFVHPYTHIMYKRIGT